MTETTLGYANPIALLLFFAFALTSLAVTSVISKRSRAVQQVRLVGLVRAGASTFSRDLYPNMYAGMPVLWRRRHAGRILGWLTKFTSTSGEAVEERFKKKRLKLYTRISVEI